MVNDRYAIVGLPRSMSSSVTALLRASDIDATHCHYFFNKYTGDLTNRSTKLFTKKSISTEWVASLVYTRLLADISGEDADICLTEEQFQRVLQISKTVVFPIEIDLNFVKELSAEIGRWFLYLYSNKELGILTTEEYRANPKDSIKKRWGLEVCEPTQLPGFKHPRPAEYREIFSNYHVIEKFWAKSVRHLAPAEIKPHLEIVDKEICATFL